MHKSAFDVMGEVLETDDKNELKDNWMEEHITEENRDLVFTLLGLQD